MISFVKVNQQFTEHKMGRIAPYHVHHVQYHFIYTIVMQPSNGKHTGPSRYPYCHLDKLENKHNIHLQLQL